MLFKKDAQNDAQQKQTKSRQETRLKSQQKFKHFKKKIYYSTVRTHVLVEDLEDPQPSTSRARGAPAIASRCFNRNLNNRGKKYIIRKYVLKCWLRRT